MDRQNVDVGAVVRAVGRVCYTEALTLAWSSVLAILGSLPLVTTGAAIVALVDVWTEVVLEESNDTVVSERARLRRFVDVWRANLVAGLPYGLPPLLVGAGGVFYFVVGVTARNVVALLWTLISLYLVVIVTVWVFRAASIRVRSPPNERPRFQDAMTRAAYSLAEEPAFSVLHVVWTGAVLALVQVFPPAFVLVGPSMVAISETVAFEELFGDGAEGIRAGYARR